MSKDYNQMYEKLVTSDLDFSGMIAYALYKREKRIATKNQRNIDEFVKLKIQPNEIRKYKTDADNLINLFLQAAADEELQKVKNELTKKISAITFNDLPKNSKLKSMLTWHNNGAAGIVGNFWTGVVVAIFVWILSDPEAWQRAKQSAYQEAAELVAVPDITPNNHLNSGASITAPAK